MKLRTLLVIPLLVASFGLQAKAEMYAFPGIGQSAVDAAGVRYDAKSYPGRRPPWDYDRVKTVAPDYPDQDRRQRHMGSGWFRLYLDLKTGAVIKVDTIRSTGFTTLDQSAISAFRRWHWKPGKWKQIDVPITFVLAQHE